MTKSDLIERQAVLTAQTLVPISHAPTISFTYETKFSYVE